MMMELLAKVTLLLGAGAAIALLLRDRSAAVRHFVFALTLGAVLALPFFTGIAPRLRLKLPACALWAKPAVAALPVSPPGGPRAIASPAPAPRVRAPHPSATGRQTHRPSLGVMLGVFWAFGAIGLLARCLIGHLGLSRLGRRAVPLRRSVLGNLVDGIETVTIALSPEVSGPVTWGWLHPVILLPTEAESWRIRLDARRADARARPHRSTRLPDAAPRARCLLRVLVPSARVVGGAPAPQRERARVRRPCHRRRDARARLRTAPPRRGPRGGRAALRRRNGALDGATVSPRRAALRRARRRALPPIRSRRSSGPAARSRSACCWCRSPASRPRSKRSPSSRTLRPAPVWSSARSRRRPASASGSSSTPEETW